MLQSIAVPTDFSRESHVAFEHSLALALAHRSALDVLHVHEPDQPRAFGHFPRVRETLSTWGVLPKGAPQEDVFAKTGVAVGKAEISDVDSVDGLARYLGMRVPDLMVMATHGRAGLDRLIKGSVSSQVARELKTPALFLGPRARSIVDEAGGLNLRRVLVPVDHDPVATSAVRKLNEILGPVTPEIDLVHVGENAPDVADAQGKALPVRLLSGPVIEAIAAEAEGADLIAMPTEGRKGLLDALRGSTIERILHLAPCPVLALPVET